MLGSRRNEKQNANLGIWVTDGSYNKLRAADLSGVGWVIFCTKTGKRLTAGWCWEKSNSANTYRAEMLGLCSLHLLARALSEYYKISKWEITISCDNKGALECSSFNYAESNRVQRAQTSEGALCPQN